MGEAFLHDVIALIRPTNEEMKREIEFSNKLLSMIRRSAPSGSEVVLTGSVAKRTFLRDKRDVDVFLLFERSFPRDRLELSVKSVMSASFPGTGYQLSYAEHPYARFHYEGRRIDLVPAYKITTAAERQSAVDRSVLHTKFVRNSMKLSQIGEVLLVKQFLRANSLYGAEIKIQGFSGYLCELLILYYGSFMKLMRAASKWNPPVLIDIKNFYSKKEGASVHEKFGDIVVIDPTDKNRNVAAALSTENAQAFIRLCRDFCRKPSRDFFFRAPESFDSKMKRMSKKGCTFLLSMPRPNVVDDVLWGQIRKLISQLNANLSEFSPKEIFADDNPRLVRIAFILGKEKLPPQMLVKGPPLEMKVHVKKFRESHKEAKFISKSRHIHARMKRKIVSAQDAIIAFFSKYEKTSSHLSYPHEMLVLERIRNRKIRKRGKGK